MNEVILFFVCLTSILLRDISLFVIENNGFYILLYLNPMYILIPLIMFLYCRSRLGGLVKTNILNLLFWGNYITTLGITISFLFLFNTRFINWDFFRSCISWGGYFFLIVVQNYISINKVIYRKKLFIFLSFIMIITICISLLLTVLKLKLLSGFFFPVFIFGEFSEMLKIGMIPDVIIFFEGFLFYYFSKDNFNVFIKNMDS